MKRTPRFRYGSVVLTVSLAFNLLGFVPAHAQKQIAITIDDLPFAYAGELSIDEQEATFLAILAALEKHDVTAVGFVNGQRVSSDWAACLDAFVDAGHLIGNHTYSHPDLNLLSVQEYVKNISKGADSIRKWLRDPKYFRYPFLHRGDTRAKREAVYATLRDQEYVVASVSIDNDEYLFNKQVVDAKGRGESLDLRDQYIAHMMERTRYFEAMADKKLHRPVKHVLLLHMNYLNGLYLDDLLQAYRDDGWEFIPLDQALSDPLYSLPDVYVGPRGISYLERIE